MIGRIGERESGISVLEARHDDDDDLHQDIDCSILLYMGYHIYCIKFWVRPILAVLIDT